MGGTDGTASMCTTEVLDMVENAWHPGPTMTFCRGNVSVAVVNEQLWYETAKCYDHIFNAHCCTFYQAFMPKTNNQPPKKFLSLALS